MATQTALLRRNMAWERTSIPAQVAPWMLPQRRHGITSRARNPYPPTFLHLDMMRNLKNDNRPRFAKMVARLGLISISAGLLSALILYTNHWFIYVQFGSWNPVKWILIGSWLVGWLLGAVHVQ